MGAIKFLDDQHNKQIMDGQIFKHHLDQMKKFWADTVPHKPIADSPKYVLDPQKWIADPQLPQYPGSDPWSVSPFPQPWAGLQAGQYPFALAMGHQFGPELSEKEKLDKAIEGYDSLIESTKRQMEYMDKQLEEITKERDNLKAKAKKEK